jgi:hypothetical protein
VCHCCAAGTFRSEIRRFSVAAPDPLTGIQKTDLDKGLDPLDKMRSARLATELASFTCADLLC